jgi:hypothetical protein
VLGPLAAEEERSGNQHQGRIACFRSEPEGSVRQRSLERSRLGEQKKWMEVRGQGMWGDRLRGGQRDSRR